ncbi:MAG TPA: hypothetical protein VHT05_01140 [Candidatus Elarobacter sp.]|jgi:hypothetical protein|nr:hypothetical protein [Candidatus Elarobacter sp.]
MMHDDFDDLDRAIVAALQPEEPPAGLHARIMAATVYRSAAAFAGWEVWVIGTLIALSAWLLWAVASAPVATQKVIDDVAGLVGDSTLGSPSTLLWLAIGVSVAWWVSLLSFPPSRRNRIEAR